MSIQTTSESICLDVVHSIYKTKIKNEVLEGGEIFPTKQEVLVKQIRVRKWFKKEGITSVEQYINSRNTVSKKRSVVFDKYSGRFYETFHPITDVIEKLEGSQSKQAIGFTSYDTKIYTRRP